MRRREFTTLLGGAVAWPIMARAQQLAGTLPRVVQLSPADNPSQADGTRRLLRELGYVEGRNIRIEFRNAGGNVDALPTLAEEVVREVVSTPSLRLVRQLRWPPTGQLRPFLLSPSSPLIRSGRGWRIALLIPVAT
jgi:hypothetical protein